MFFREDDQGCDELQCKQRHDWTPPFAIHLQANAANLIRVFAIKAKLHQTRSPQTQSMRKGRFSSSYRSRMLLKVTWALPTLNCTALKLHSQLIFLFLSRRRQSHKVVKLVVSARSDWSWMVGSGNGCPWLAFVWWRCHVSGRNDRNKIYANIPGNVAIMRWRSTTQLLRSPSCRACRWFWQEYMRPLLVQVGVCHWKWGKKVHHSYSAFRQKFPKLWTSVAHSFLQQIAQNKNWAHPKATTLPRICKVEMPRQQASLLYYSAKPQSGGILVCALVCPTSLYVRTIRFPTFCRSLPSVGAYSQYPAWSGCRRSADVPRADHRVGSSPWQGGFKERVYCACLPSICLIFSTCKYAATAFNFKHKKTINVTDLSWPKTFRYRF